MKHLIIALLCTAIIGCSASTDSDDSQQLARRADLAMRSLEYADIPLDDIRGNAAAMQLAGDLFAMHCSGCHGTDGTGSKGVTDLTRARFNHGTSAEAIRTTIRDGRTGAMPRMGDEYGEVELGQIVAYIGTLGTGKQLDDYESRGMLFYRESCVVCHGEDGTGVAALGAPDLTDDYWQHGDSMMNKRLVITRGVTAECPAQAEVLTPAEIELLTARVLQLAAG